MTTKTAQYDVLTEIAFYSLLYRATESSFSFGLFKDLQAVRWLEELDFKFAPVEAFSSYIAQLATACRTKLFNDEIKGFEGRVINLGAGFCTRGLSHDKAEWIDMDLGEVMDLRLDYCQDWKARQLCGDVMDDVFMTSLISDQPTLVLLESVLDNFTDKEARGILKRVRKFSKELTVVFDACGTVFRDVPHPVQSNSGELHIIRWGLDVPKELEYLGYKVIKDTYIHEVAKDRWLPAQESFKQYPIIKDHSSRIIVLEGV